MSTFRSPLARAKGLGSAKEGVHHWWMQRLTAIALVPLVLVGVFSLALLGDASYETLTRLLAHPVVAIMMILLIITLFYHSSLGLQVVVEDYVGVEWLRMLTIILINFINIILAVSSIFAVLRIAVGAGA